MYKYTVYTHICLPFLRLTRIALDVQRVSRVSHFNRAATFAVWCFFAIYPRLFFRCAFKIARLVGILEKKKFNVFVTKYASGIFRNRFYRYLT